MYSLKKIIRFHCRHDKKTQSVNSIETYTFGANKEMRHKNEEIKYKRVIHEND